MHKRRLDCRRSIFWSLSRTMSSYLSCLSYFHVVWTNLTVTAFSIGFIVLSLWIVIFSFFGVLNSITKSRTTPPSSLNLRKGMNKEALEAEASVASSGSYWLKHAPNFLKGNITSFTEDVFSSLQETQQLCFHHVFKRTSLTIEEVKRYHWMMESCCTRPV